MSIKKPAKPDKKASSLQLRSQIRLMLGDEIAMGPGKADLLEAIRDIGSISAAGKQMGMSYRRAWLLVDAMNRCFNEPLVATAKGGSHGGGAQLTPAGEKLLLVYRTLQMDVNAAAEKHFKKLKPMLRDMPLPVADTSSK